MAAAELEYDPEKSQVLLTADPTKLARDSTFRAYLRGEGGTILSDGRTAIPTRADHLHLRFQELSALLERLGFSLQAKGGAADIVVQVQADEVAFEQFSAQAADIWAGRVESQALDEFARVLEEKLPGRTLYPLQMLAAFHLAFAQHACNFSVPGAGKTATVLAAFAYLQALPPDHPKHVDHLLVVGPLASFKAWNDEFQQGFRRPARMRRIAGFTPLAERRSYLRGLTFDEEPSELTVTTYATLASAPSDFTRFLQLPGRRSMVVLDEAHNIKRGDGVWATAALALAPHAVARVALTGTPAPNGYEDLSNLFKFLYPNRDVVGFAPTALRAMTEGQMPAGVAALKSRLQPYYTRIRKADLGLPDFGEERVSTPLSPLHREIYSAVEKVVMPQLRASQQAGQPSSLVRANLIRLRQAAVNPALLMRPLSEEGLFDPDGGGFSSSELEIAGLVARFNPALDLVRLVDTVSLVRETVQAQGKVVVWSYFLGNLELLRSALSAEADYVEVLTGATPVQEDGQSEDEPSEVEVDPATREAIIDRFHRQSEKAILIANPQAVGESISLHRAARTAIYFDRDFNAGRFIQSKDRIHRYSQEPLGPVQYFFLLAEGTLDTTIDARLAQKEARLADLVDSAEIPLFGLADPESGDEDIKAILRDYERRKAH